MYSRVIFSSTHKCKTSMPIGYQLRPWGSAQVSLCRRQLHRMIRGNSYGVDVFPFPETTGTLDNRLSPFLILTTNSCVTFLRKFTMHPWWLCGWLVNPGCPNPLKVTLNITYVCLVEIMNKRKRISVQRLSGFTLFLCQSIVQTWPYRW